MLDLDAIETTAAGWESAVDALNAVRLTAGTDPTPTTQAVLAAAETAERRAFDAHLEAIARNHNAVTTREGGPR